MDITAVRWNKLREATNCPVLYVTGTAYKMVWDFADSERYIYSYYEEQLDKKRGLNDRPSMKVILAKYESAQYQAIYGDDPDAMKNLFNVDDEGNFVEEALVQEFVSSKFAVQRQLRSKVIVCLKIQTTCILHCLQLLLAMPLLSICKGTRFAPLVVTGRRVIPQRILTSTSERIPMVLVSLPVLPMFLE